MIEHSGIGAYLRALLPHIVEVGKLAGLNFTFIGPAEKLAQHPYIRNCGEIYDYSAPIYCLREQLAFPRLRDVRATHFPHYNVPLRLRGSFFVTVHDIIPLVCERYRGRLVHRAALSLLLSNLAKKAVRIFVPSPWVAEELGRRYPETCMKTEIVPYAASDSLSRVEPKEAHAVWDRLGVRHPYLLCVSIDKPHKNLRFLLDVWAKALRSGATGECQQLVLAGLRPGDVPRLVNFMRQMLWSQDQVASVVLIDRFLSEFELGALYTGATAVVTTSMLEGFGMPIVEAQKIGVPVLAPSLPWAQYTAGNAALYFSPNDPHSLVEAINRIATNFHLRTELMAEGRQNMSRFSWRRSAERMVDAYLSSL
jgi:glycosyltransferase involved in cell wall biosynthesis